MKPTIIESYKYFEQVKMTRQTPENPVRKIIVDNITL